MSDLSTGVEVPDWDNVKFYQLKKGDRIEEGDWMEVYHLRGRGDPCWVKVTCAGKFSPDPRNRSSRVLRRVVKDEHESPALNGEQRKAKYEALQRILARALDDPGRDVISNLLKSSDSEWYEKGMGHDWRAAVDAAEEFLRQTDN